MKSATLLILEEINSKLDTLVMQVMQFPLAPEQVERMDKHINAIRLDPKGLKIMWAKRKVELEQIWKAT